MKLTTSPVVAKDGTLTFSLVAGKGTNERRVDVPLALEEVDRERQMREPIQLLEMAPNLWLYRNKLVVISGGEDRSVEETVLSIKHKVLREERAFERLRREVAAFERFEQISKTPREPIPDEVRMFVWQRDEGRCAKCGGRERMEFDHIIPLALGGANTERNIQLLCETCNRQKGANVV
jgi:hypothetical protein